MAQVGAALEEPVDYLGFGPIGASATKGYERGYGSEVAWVASQASTLPLFPIGGIGLAEAAELQSGGTRCGLVRDPLADDPAASGRCDPRRARG
jgi:thiamine monophosphate synthase